MVNKKLKLFMYLLMRDSVVPGEVARIIQEIDSIKSNEVTFIDQHLSAYAEKLSKKLKGKL